MGQVRSRASEEPTLPTPSYWTSSLQDGGGNEDLFLFSGSVRDVLLQQPSQTHTQGSAGLLPGAAVVRCLTYRCFQHFVHSLPSTMKVETQNTCVPSLSPVRGGRWP